MTGSPGTGSPESESQFNFKQISYLFTRKSSYLEQSLICVNSLRCALHPRPRPPQKHVRLLCTVCDYLSDFTTYRIISEVVAEENTRFLLGVIQLQCFTCLHLNWFVLSKCPLFYAFGIYFSNQRNQSSFQSPALL